MGYFANGTSRESYEAEWCNRCIFGNKCFVMFAHLTSSTLADESNDLHTIIPTGKHGYPLKCRMFVDKEIPKRSRAGFIADNFPELPGIKKGDQ